MKMTAVDKIAQLLLVIGGLNWGLIAIKDSYDLVGKLGASASKIVYYLVGLAAVYSLYKMFAMMSEKSE